MVDKKSFWKSKTIWAAVITGVLGVISAFGVSIPVELYALLAAFGLHGLRTAKTSLK